MRSIIPLISTTQRGGDPWADEVDSYGRSKYDEWGRFLTPDERPGGLLADGYLDPFYNNGDTWWDPGYNNTGGMNVFGLDGRNHIIRNSDIAASYNFRWNPWGGRELSETDWTRLGGDPGIINRNAGSRFFSGGWQLHQIGNEQVGFNTKTFGAIANNETALSFGNSHSFVGNYILELKYTDFQGSTNDAKKGLLNYNSTIRNGRLNHSVSIDIGKFSYSTGLTSGSISYNGYSFHFDGSIARGITYGVSYTNGNNRYQGREVTINPFKVVPIATGILIQYAPYLLPVAVL